MNDAPWMSRWARSPRQDRRVIEDGKFVEQGKVHEPVIPVVEESNSALEIINEPATSTGTDVVPNGLVETNESEHRIPGSSGEENRPGETGTSQLLSDAFVSSTEGESISEASQAELEPIDAATDFLEIPPVPPETWQFIEDAQKANEIITGTPKTTPTLLPEGSQDPTSENVLDGQTRRITKSPALGAPYKLND